MRVEQLRQIVECASLPARLGGGDDLRRQPGRQLAEQAIGPLASPPPCRGVPERQR